MHFSHVTLSSSLTVLDRNAEAEECVLFTFNVAKSPSHVMQLCLFVHPETAGIKLVSLATQRCYLWLCTLIVHHHPVVRDECIWRKLQEKFQTHDILIDSCIVLCAFF